MANMTIEEILNMNKVEQGEDDVPEEFPPAPPKVGDFKGSTENEYKDYMKLKFAREQWENSLVAYNMRKREGDEAGMKRVLDNLINAEKVAAMKVSDTTVDVNEANAMDDLMRDEVSEVTEEETPRNLRHLQDVSPSKKGNPDPPKGKYKKKNSSDSDDDFYQKDEVKKPKEVRVGQVGHTSEYKIKYLNLDERHVLFIPIQIIIMVFAIIMTAVGSWIAPIILGIFLAIPLACFASWIIMTRRYDAMLVVLFAYFVFEAFSIILCLIGGFMSDSYYALYMGLPSVAFCVAATVTGVMGILNQSPPIGRDNIRET